MVCAWKRTADESIQVAIMNCIVGTFLMFDSSSARTASASCWAVVREHRATCYFNGGAVTSGAGSWTVPVHLRDYGAAIQTSLLQCVCPVPVRSGVLDFAWLNSLQVMTTARGWDIQSPLKSALTEVDTSSKCWSPQSASYWGYQSCLSAVWHQREHSELHNSMSHNRSCWMN